MINHNLAKNLSTQYANGLPFPHIVIDNFIEDQNCLEKVLEEFRTYAHWGYDNFSLEHQVNKFFSPWCADNVADMPKTVVEILKFFNSAYFLHWLERLTGIQNLIADDTFAGGGMHRIDTNGKLSVHADYSLHPHIPNLYRRLNLLLYLNKDWNPEWGGSLQLYDYKTKIMVHDIQPIFNRAVIFSTTTDALHGHPHALACPADRQRLSLALYYFTVEPPPSGVGTNISALWHQI